jgi:hypothetical protein
MYHETNVELHGNLANRVDSIDAKLDAVVRETMGLSAIGRALAGEVPEHEEGESARNYTKDAEPEVSHRRRAASGEG